MANTKKTLKRNNRGSRNLTRKANLSAQNYVSERLQLNLTGAQIRNHTRNLNKNFQNRVNRYLNSMGM